MAMPLSALPASASMIEGKSVPPLARSTSMPAAFIRPRISSAANTPSGRSRLMTQRIPGGGLAGFKADPPEGSPAALRADPL